MQEQYSLDHCQDVKSHNRRVSRQSMIERMKGLCIKGQNCLASWSQAFWIKIYYHLQKENVASSQFSAPKFSCSIKVVRSVLVTQFARLQQMSQEMLKRQLIWMNLNHRQERFLLRERDNLHCPHLACPHQFALSSSSRRKADARTK